MPTIKTDDGVNLNYTDDGAGTPIVFVHEFGTDQRSFDVQVRHFSRRYRCITYNARGFPPSDVPTDVTSYSQLRGVQDLKNVLDGLSIAKAHVVAVSMGSFTGLEFALQYPEKTLSLVLAACGYGVQPDQNATFREQLGLAIATIQAGGMQDYINGYVKSPTRVQLENKDPAGYAEFVRNFKEASETGLLLTMMGILVKRPCFDAEFAARLKTLKMPCLIVNGDEDGPALEPGMFLKREIDSADMVVLPGTGHTLHLEEPLEFARHLDSFLHQVSSGRWRSRDPRTKSKSMLGLSSAPSK